MGADVLNQSISLFLPALTETPGQESIWKFGTSENAGPIWHLLLKVDDCILQISAVRKLGEVVDKFDDIFGSTLSTSGIPTQKHCIYTTSNQNILVQRYGSHFRLTLVQTVSRFP